MNNILTLREVCDRANANLACTPDGAGTRSSTWAHFMLDAIKWARTEDTEPVQTGRAFEHGYQGYTAQFRSSKGMRRVILQVSMAKDNPIAELVRHDTMFLTNWEEVIKVNRVGTKGEIVLAPLTEELGNMPMTGLIQRGIDIIEGRIADVMAELAYVDETLSGKNLRDFFQSLHWVTTWLSLNGGRTVPMYPPKSDAAEKAEFAAKAWRGSIFNPDARRSILDNASIKQIINKTNNTEGK